MKKMILSGLVAVAAVVSVGCQSPRLIPATNASLSGTPCTPCPSACARPATTPTAAIRCARPSARMATGRNVLGLPGSSPNGGAAYVQPARAGSAASAAASLMIRTIFAGVEDRERTS